MVIVALGLGSNLAPPDVPPFDRPAQPDVRARALEGALGLLEERGLRVLRASRLHETAPVALEPGAPAFLNAAVLVESEAALTDVLEHCQAVERVAGRRRQPGVTASRSLDVDLLAAWDGEGSPLELDRPGLRLPHPRLSEREFALAPLAEVAAVLPLPGGVTPADLLARLRASSGAATWRVVPSARYPHPAGPAILEVE